jgi:hypothetical protein
LVNIIPHIPWLAVAAIIIYNFFSEIISIILHMFFYLPVFALFFALFMGISAVVVFGPMMLLFRIADILDKKYSVFLEKNSKVKMAYQLLIALFVLAWLYPGVLIFVALIDFLSGLLD